MILSAIVLFSGMIRGGFTVLLVTLSYYLICNGLPVAIEFFKGGSPFARKLLVGLTLLFPNFSRFDFKGMIVALGYWPPPSVLMLNLANVLLYCALVLSLAGLGLVAQVWQDARLDALGVAAGLGGAACLATFLLLGRHSGGAHDPVAVNFWMFAWASAFWLVVEPLWGIDWAPLGETTSLLGGLSSVEVPVWLAAGWVIVLGTLAPYALDLAALRNLPATTVGAVGMLEPVVAAGVAWLWLEQALTGVQVLGGLVVLVGVALAQASRRADDDRVPDPPL